MTVKKPALLTPLNKIRSPSLTKEVLVAAHVSWKKNALKEIAVFVRDTSTQ
jgi:hypothetical protein